jgi:hypothetical protein
LVTASTEASEASLHLPKQFLLKNQAADNNGYFVATKSGFATVSSPIDFAKDE